MKKLGKPGGTRPSTHPRPSLHPQTFHLDLISDPKEIRRVEPFLLDVNSVARLDDGTFYRLLVATTEAVNNGIVHGNKSNPKKHVHVTCTVKPDSLTLIVSDEGRGFRPDRIPDPLDEKNLLKTSGRGVFLMRSLMDSVSFDITPRGTHVTLVVNLKLLR